MSDGEEWMPGLVLAELSDDEESVQPRRSSRARKQVDYGGENHDGFFAECPGYTNFGRTRKGGDKRPRKSKKKERIALFVIGVHAGKFNYALTQLNRQMQLLPKINRGRRVQVCLISFQLVALHLLLLQ